MTKRSKAGTTEEVEDFRVDTFLEAIENVYKAYGLVLITPHSDEPIVHKFRPSDLGQLQSAGIGADVQYVS